MSDENQSGTFERIASVPADTGSVQQAPKSRRRSRRRAVTPASPALPLTFEKRLEATKAEAKRLSREKKTRIPLRLGVSLELHEAMVEIARKLGASSGAMSVADVAGRAMELGVEQWARTIKVRIEGGVQALTVFERTPAASNVRDYGGPSEQQIRDELAAEADERSRQHEVQAEELHIPGRRRRAAAS